MTLLGSVVVNASLRILLLLLLMLFGELLEILVIQRRLRGRRQ